MNTIYLTDSVYTTIKNHPEVKALLIELGFTPLSQPHMLQTLGRVTSLQKGSQLTKIPLEEIVKELEINGYIVKESRDENE